MKNIIIFTPYFLPGYKGGGPIKSISGIVNEMSNKFNFYIITGDRDLGDKQKYEGIKTNQWLDEGIYKIMYIDTSNTFQYLSLVKTIFTDINIDLIYLNSLFNFKYSIIPVILNKIYFSSNNSILLAPRGELDPGALSIKRLKKLFYISLSKTCKLYNNVNFHATSVNEFKYIKDYSLSQDNIYNVSNISQTTKILNQCNKEIGHLSLVFLSRISRKKNLDYALNIIKLVGTTDPTIKIDFDIYGTLEDKEYWEECKGIMNDVKNQNININYISEVNPSQTISILSNYHVFFFPTRGENFGHVIVEALSAQLSIIISDQTPWSDVESNNCGFAIPLTDEQDFVNKIIYYANLNNKNWIEIKQNSHKYLEKKLNTRDNLRKMENMFLSAM